MSPCVHMYTRSTVYPSMQVVALVAQKGGAGKTSLALALAVAAVSEGRTVVVLDADPQASACSWRDRRQADAPVVTDVQPSRLRHAVDAAAEQDVDLVVIDTPPRSETAALEAAKVADLVVPLPGAAGTSTLRSRCARSRRRSPCPPSGRRASSSSAMRAPRSAARAQASPRSTGTP